MFQTGTLLLSRSLLYYDVTAHPHISTRHNSTFTELVSCVYNMLWWIFHGITVSTPGSTQNDDNNYNRFLRAFLQLSTKSNKLNNHVFSKYLFTMFWWDINLSYYFLWLLACVVYVWPTFSCQSRQWRLSDRKCDRTQLPWQPVSGSCDGWRRQHLRLARIQQVSLVPYPVRSALHAASRHGHRQDQVLWDLHPSLNFISVS